MIRKKILVVYPAPLLPAIMMSQKRTIEQIHALNKEHEVGVISISRTESESDESVKYFKKHNINCYVVQTGVQNKFIRKINSFLYWINFRLFNVRVEYQKNRSTKVVKEVIQITKGYDIVISHFWFGSEFFKSLSDKIKFLDAHGLVEEFLELNQTGHFLTEKPKHENKVFHKNLQYQHEIHAVTDYLIMNSKKSFDIATQNYPECKVLYCPNGQNLNEYKEFADVVPDPNTVLFYGSYSGAQNLIALELFYKNIWPILCQKKPFVKLLVVGNHPPKWIQDEAVRGNVEVTGFVKDIRPYISRAVCMVIPMTVGVGFRGRIVEVMALGVPVIGNRNALDCIGLDQGVNGFISDDYADMANYAIDLLDDPDYRRRISENTLNFVHENYSIEATFGKLSCEIGEL